MTKPTSPVPKEPADNWEHTALYRRVRKALYSVPVYFKTETVISGVMAGDLHTLGTLLGATVEEQVVQTLTARDLYALVVNLDFLIGFKIVPHQHFLFAANERGANLYG